MPLNQIQLDSLEKQHKESLKNYSEQVRALQNEVTRLTDDIKNLNAVIDSHVITKQKELDDKIAVVNKLNFEATGLRKEAQELLYTAQAKTEEANKIHAGVLESSAIHETNVKTHLDCASHANDDISKRHGQCAEREMAAIDKINEANKRIDLAIMAEKKAQEEVNKISEINDAIKADIEIQKDLYFKNKQTLDAVTIIKQETQAIKEKSEADMADAIKIRDSLDAAQARIERNSQELIKRNDEAKAREIQCQVTEQQLKDRKAYLDGQEGRLNELKNNVMALQANLEKQQASATAIASAVVPKEGA